MKIYARKELKGLVGRVESELEATLKERKELGLSIPKDYNTSIAFYNAQTSIAQAGLTEIGPKIDINVAPLIFEKLKIEDKEKLKKVMNYFNIVRDFIGNKDEDFIFSMIENPTKEIEVFEESFSPKRLLKEYQDLFNSRGTGYDAYKKTIKLNSKNVDDKIKELYPIIEKSFETIDLSSLRHEIDHVDLFESPMFLDYYKKSIKSSELGQEWYKNKTKSNSNKFANTNKTVLGLRSKIDPILEARALFFSNIETGEWEKVDFDNIKKKVYSDFINYYVELAFPENILDTLVSYEWSKGQMDRQTSNYLFKIVNKQIGSPSHMRYSVNLEQVNYDTANRVLYQDLPRWKHRFAKNAKIAVETIGNAYRDDPSRLKKTKKARTFEEFIELCNK